MLTPLLPARSLLRALACRAQVSGTGAEADVELNRELDALLARIVLLENASKLTAAQRAENERIQADTMAHTLEHATDRARLREVEELQRRGEALFVEKMKRSTKNSMRFSVAFVSGTADEHDVRKIWVTLTDKYGYLGTRDREVAEVLQSNCTMDAVLSEARHFTRPTLVETWRKEQEELLAVDLDKSDFVCAVITVTEKKKERVDASTALRMSIGGNMPFDQIGELIKLQVELTRSNLAQQAQKTAPRSDVLSRWAHPRSDVTMSVTSLS